MTAKDARHTGRLIHEDVPLNRHKRKEVELGLKFVARRRGIGPGPGPPPTAVTWTGQNVRFDLWFRPASALTKEELGGRSETMEDVLGSTAIRTGRGAWWRKSDRITSQRDGGRTKSKAFFVVRGQRK